MKVDRELLFLYHLGVIQSPELEKAVIEEVDRDIALQYQLHEMQTGFSSAPPAFVELADTISRELIAAFDSPWPTPAELRKSVLEPSLAADSGDDYASARRSIRISFEFPAEGVEARASRAVLSIPSDASDLIVDAAEGDRNCLLIETFGEPLQLPARIVGQSTEFELTVWDGGISQNQTFLLSTHQLHELLGEDLAARLMLADGEGRQAIGRLVTKTQ